MAQLVGFLLCKCENLSLDDHHPCRKLDTIAPICNTSDGEAKAGGSLELIGHTACWINKLQVQWETVSRNKVHGQPREVVQRLRALVALPEYQDSIPNTTGWLTTISNYSYGIKYSLLASVGRHTAGKSFIHIFKFVKCKQIKENIQFLLLTSTGSHINVSIYYLITSTHPVMIFKM